MIHSPFFLLSTELLVHKTDLVISSEMGKWTTSNRLSILRSKGQIKWLFSRIDRWNQSARTRSWNLIWMEQQGDGEVKTNHPLWRYQNHQMCYLNKQRARSILRSVANGVKTRTADWPHANVSVSKDFRIYICACTHTQTIARSTISMCSPFFSFFHALVDFLFLFWIFPIIFESVISFLRTILKKAIQKRIKNHD